MTILVVGAGFSGAVVARLLAEKGYRCKVVDARSHVAGNCHTKRDAVTGIMVHAYGPHIFHTNSEKVWGFVNRFAKFMPYVNRVKTTIKGNVYSLPINLHTINQFFGRALSPSEAKQFITELADQTITKPRNFEEQALKLVGKDIYEAFFKGYTKKQWGLEPKDLPASILKRLPIRFNYDDNYYYDKYQGIPSEGYTELVNNILNHDCIDLHLNAEVTRREAANYKYVFYSGPIDEWFDNCYGRLGYRTLDFEEITSDCDIQGCAVMNYGDYEVPYTRISEHKYFSPWESHTKTIAFKEYSRMCEQGDIPYYPIRLINEQELLRKYVDKAHSEKNVSFIGRLGTYRYLDMDDTILEAMSAANEYLKLSKKNQSIPSFFTKVL